MVVRRRSRLERAQQGELAAARLAAGQPQRQVAADLGLARSTLQDWCKPVPVGAAPAALAAFVASPQGVQWLHRLVLAAHFAITLKGGAGVRVVCEFLELSGLSAFVGAAYGTQYALNVALEEAVGAVGREQRAALAAGMAHRSVTVCEDETFHPQICLVALEHGRAQSVERVARRFEDVWTRLQRLAEAADLPTRARERLAKAQRLTTQLLATIAFFFTTLHMQVEALGLPPSLEAALVEQLIPALYLARVAARRTHAEPRQRLQALSTQLLEPLRQPAHPLQALSGAERARLQQVADECADRFQRSSSAVEGRNGQLSLHHHGRHRLSDRKLAALTAVHNFHIRRADGTTAAERFFGRAHESLFAQVLQQVPLPPRPARRRPCPPSQPSLMPVAA